jgi:quercetin dioxygenase-like cupin family protein
MRKWLLVLVLASGANAQAPSPPSTEDKLVADPSTAKFAPITVPGFAPGAEGAPIGVDPNTRGQTGYAKFPAKYRISAHWHSYAEYVTMISGKATLTLDGKLHHLVPGSYVVIPAKTPHELTCGDSTCLTISRRAGPADYNWVK